MKRIRTIILSVLFAAMMLAGCGAVKFDTTTVFGKTTIKVQNAEDGDTGESGVIHISKNQSLQFESALDSGSLNIGFCEAIDVSTGDETDDYIAGDVMDTISIGPGESVNVALSPGPYILQYTAVGKTNGTITANVH